MNSRSVFVEVKRSKRKTIAITIDAKGKVSVKAPFRMSDSEIREFLREKQAWIVKKQEEMRGRSVRHQAEKDLEMTEVAPNGFTYGEWAKQIIPRRVRELAVLMQVPDGQIGRITIRQQKTRWGSCSSKGNLNFNWRLILMPEEVMDYVIIHELCHLKYMNHSRDFWNYVEQIMPDYRNWKQWLKEW